MTHPPPMAGLRGCASRLLLATAMLTACGSFEDPTIVLDLRILAAQATIPEQVVDIDPSQPIDPQALLAQIEPVDVCWLLADPAADRALDFELGMCPPSADERCNSDEPYIALAKGTLPDPDTTPNAAPPCMTVQPDTNLLGVLLASLENDDLGGLGGVDVSATIKVGEIYGAKTFRVTPRIPMERTGNRNPTVDRFTVAITPPDVADRGPEMDLPLGRCADIAAPIEVRPHAELRITPVESADAHETYVVPTLQGGSQTLVEALTYQWLAGNGDYSSASTGGPRDIAGNPAPLFVDWIAPEFQVASDEPLTAPTLVPLWIIQRDERLGSTWYESCVRVIP